MTTFTLVTSMKNEGPFIIEWIAYHKVIGFDRIVIASNDCDDRSDELLARLDQAGFISHYPNVVQSGRDPQYVALLALVSHPAVKSSDWAMVLDADEFLNINVGEGRLADLTARFGDADAIAILWKNFGDSHWTFWEHGSVITRFVWREAEIYPDNRFHKTLFRNNGKWRGMGAHYPIRATGIAGHDVKVVNTEGSQYDLRRLENRERLIGLIPRIKSLWTWANATVNHYPVKTLDLLAMKRHRGDNVPGLAETKFVPGSPYHLSGTRNEVKDVSIQRMMPETFSWMGIMRSDPLIAKAEAESLKAFDAIRLRLLR